MYTGTVCCRPQLVLQTCRVCCYSERASRASCFVTSSYMISLRCDTVPSARSTDRLVCSLCSERPLLSCIINFRPWNLCTDAIWLQSATFSRGHVSDATVIRARMRAPRVFLRECDEPTAIVPVIRQRRPWTAVAEVAIIISPRRALWEQSSYAGGTYCMTACISWFSREICAIIVWSWSVVKQVITGQCSVFCGQIWRRWRQRILFPVVKIQIFPTHTHDGEFTRSALV